MWVARNKEGIVNLYWNKPTRYKDYWVGDMLSDRNIGELFNDNDLKWEDEPEEISIVNKEYLNNLEKIMDMYEEEHCSIDTDKLNNMLGEALDKETADTYNKKYNEYACSEG